MSDTQRTELLARDTVLKLLSDTESARVSSAEGTANLEDGVEYLDLEHTQAGIQVFQRATSPAMGTIVPRNAVSDATWSKIIAFVSSAKAG